ncbi:MAG TPA: hypothetical protein VKX46_09790 [Ktedonobacteraceae bacterium]|nr:hypothetical protein [Ktedonobacteraceae bacterium]
MTSFLERYLRGECEQVWEELLGLGAQVRKEPLHSDALAVARETMRRVRRNCEILIERLERIGYIFGYSWARPALVEDIDKQPPPLGTPLPDIQDRLDALEQVGALLPLSLRAFYEIVGSVNFVGVSTSAMAAFEYGEDAVASDEDADLSELVDEDIDPLFIAAFDKKFTPAEYRSWINEEEGAYTVITTYDTLSKYFRSDVEALFMEVPNPNADAPMLHGDGTGINLVAYLRYCLQHGGLPGSDGVYEPLGEKTLAYVTKDLLPI